MRDLLIVLLIVSTVALGFYLLHREDKPPLPQDIHSATPKEAESSCEPTDMTLACNGSKPK